MFTKFYTKITMDSKATCNDFVFIVISLCSLWLIKLLIIRASLSKSKAQPWQFGLNT